MQLFHLPIYPGSALRAVKNKQKDVIYVPGFILENPRYFWVKTRPSRMIMCLIRTPSKLKSTTLVYVAWWRDASKVTMQPCWHMVRYVYILSSSEDYHVSAISALHSMFCIVLCFKLVFYKKNSPVSPLLLNELSLKCFFHLIIFFYIFSRQVRGRLTRWAADLTCR